MLLNEILPVKLDGGASMQITHNEEWGDYYVLLLNNSGIERSVADGERYLEDGGICVDITMEEGRKLNVIEGNGAVSPIDGDRYRIEIPSGGWLFGKF